MPNHEFINFFGVHVRVTHHMWSWPHNRHIPKQHIKKLWQFIYTGFSYKFTHFRNTLIISGSLIYMGVSIGHHRAKLITVKFFVIKPIPGLFKKYRALGFQLDKDGY